MGTREPAPDFAATSILVTGGASGIGRETAQLMADLGGSVAVADVQEERGTLAVREMVRAGARAHFIAADVRSPLDVERMFEERGRPPGGCRRPCPLRGDLRRDPPAADRAAGMGSRAAGQSHLHVPLLPGRAAAHVPAPPRDHRDHRLVGCEVGWDCGGSALRGLESRRHLPDEVPRAAWSGARRAGELRLPGHDAHPDDRPLVGGDPQGPCEEDSAGETGLSARGSGRGDLLSRFGESRFHHRGDTGRQRREHHGLRQAGEVDMDTIARVEALKFPMGSSSLVDR